jgi:hypothetical protein
MTFLPPSILIKLCLSEEETELYKKLLSPSALADRSFMPCGTSGL